jgi:hypothetical protein
MTREEYLRKALDLFQAHLFEPQGFEVPQDVQVSVGYPKGARGGKGFKAIGQAWAPTVSEDGKSFNVFISPEVGDGVTALATLLHEQVHCVVGLEAGHKAPFKRCATAVGLTGKMTATSPSEGLQSYLEALIQGELGEYPHAAMNPKKKGGKGSRLVKVVCPRCSDGDRLYVVRMTRSWLDSLGAPICPGCEEQMQEAV